MVCCVSIKLNVLVWNLINWVKLFSKFTVNIYQPSFKPWNLKFYILKLPVQTRPFHRVICPTSVEPHRKWTSGSLIQHVHLHKNLIGVHVYVFWERCELFYFEAARALPCNLIFSIFSIPFSPQWMKCGVMPVVAISCRTSVSNPDWLLQEMTIRWNSMPSLVELLFLRILKITIKVKMHVWKRLPWIVLVL